MKFPHIKLEQSKIFKDSNGEPLWNFKILDPNNDYAVVAGFTGQTFQNARDLAQKKAHELWAEWTGAPQSIVYEEPDRKQRYAFVVRHNGKEVHGAVGYHTYGDAKDAADAAIDEYVAKL